MSLTDTQIRGTDPTDKPAKLYDSDGLYLLVKPTGSKLWRFKYRMGGVEKLISLGSYPEISLAKARQARDAARRSVAANTDPSAERQAARATEATTFGALAREYIALQAKKLDPDTIRKLTYLLTEYLGPALGDLPIERVEAADVLDVLRKMEELHGLGDSVQRAKMLACQVARYAKTARRLRAQFSSDDFRGMVITRPTEHRAALTNPKQVGELLRTIDDYQGEPQTRLALQLAALVFLRSGELRSLEWSWIDWGAALIRIPARVMKMKDDHLVPLAPQAIAVLREAQKITGKGEVVFTGTNGSRLLGENTLNYALRRMGYSRSQHTFHGFRTTASTLLAEMGVEEKLIELQLAHKERNKVKAAYNRAERLEDRRAMMLRWADYLEGLQ